MNSLKAELSTAFADRAEAEQDTKQLQHELQDALQQLDQLQRRQGRRSADWCEAELKRLDDEVGPSSCMHAGVLWLGCY